jgi:hypothetical protein
MSTNITVPDDLYQRVLDRAMKDGLSVQEFVSRVLADRLAARDFIDARAELFSRGEFEKALDYVPDVEPEPHDRL